MACASIPTFAHQKNSISIRIGQRQTKISKHIYGHFAAFGKNTSAIGLGTNKTLDAADKNYKWIDHGKAIQSVPVETNWNAIDPNLLTDEAERWFGVGHNATYTFDQQDYLVFLATMPPTMENQN